MNNGERTIALTLMAALALIGYREIKATSTLPAPHAMLSAATAYTLLLLLAGPAPQLAAVLGFGVLIALAMQPGILSPGTFISKITLPPGSVIGVPGVPGGASSLTTGKGTPLPSTGGPTGGIGIPGVPGGAGSLTGPGASGANVTVPPGYGLGT